VLKILIGISLLIIYGSFYPFDFDFGTVSAIKLSKALSFNPFATSRGDILGNVALFIPFGLAGIFSIDRPNRITLKLIMLIVGGLFLAAAVQVGQLFTPGRVPTTIDVFWNAVGMAIGGVTAALPQVRNLVSARVHSEGTNVPFFLSVIWIAYRLMPFVPTIGFQEIKDSVKPLIFDHQLSFYWLYQHIVTWLVFFHFLSVSPSTRRYISYLPGLVLLVLGAQLFIVSNTVTLKEVLGSGLGLVVWFTVRRMLRPGMLACLLLLAIYPEPFYPFEILSHPRSFNWIPFTGFLTGAMETNALSLLKKLYLYGSLIWLLCEVGFGRLGAMFSVAGALALSEALQIFVASSTPESTDPIMAIIIGMGLFYLQDMHTGSNRLGRSKDVSDLRVTRNELNISKKTAPVDKKRRRAEWTKVPIWFKQDQIQFLKKFSNRKEISVSRAVRIVIVSSIENADYLKAKLARKLNFGATQTDSGGKERCIINLRAEQLAFINTLAREMGISVSKVVRLIIDDFIKNR